MKFKTEEGQAAFDGMLADVSERAIRMYEEAKRDESVSAYELFMMNIQVETFQRDGLNGSIRAATEVDCQVMSMKGHLAAAMIQR